MKIEVHRNESSYVLTYENVVNAYTKGPMYCILFEKDGRRIVHKYPLCSIFRIEEDDYPSKR